MEYNNNTDTECVCRCLYILCYDKGEAVDHKFKWVCLLITDSVVSPDLCARSNDKI